MYMDWGNPQLKLVVEVAMGTSGPECKHSYGAHHHLSHFIIAVIVQLTFLAWNSKQILTFYLLRNMVRENPE